MEIKQLSKAIVAITGALGLAAYIGWRVGFEYAESRMLTLVQGKVIDILNDKIDDEKEEESKKSEEEA